MSNKIQCTVMKNNFNPLLKLYKPVILNGVKNLKDKYEIFRSCLAGRQVAQYDKIYHWRNLSYLFLVVILVSPVNAQRLETNLTGSLYTDSKVLIEKNNIKSLPQLIFQEENRKSPFLAGVLSFVLPGAGEFYSGSYLKTAIFVVVEAAVVTTAVIYDNKGDDQTDKFQKFADENWSVVKYAQWLNATQSEVDIFINPDESLPSWERVGWAELNAAEHGSHKLPQHGTQQYYELIGKYLQYIPGWPDGNDIITPPQIMLNYSGMRGKANDYYNVASKAVIGIYINHFLSALDAVWTATQHNKSLALKMRMEKVQFADRMELVPTLKLSFNF